VAIESEVGRGTRVTLEAPIVGQGAGAGSASR